MKKSKQANRDKHAAYIKRKYFMEGKYIKVSSMSAPSYTRSKPNVFLCSHSDFGYNFLEIKAPHTLDKIIKMLKENKMTIYDLDEDRKYATFEEYLQNKMILRLAGIE